MSPQRLGGLDAAFLAAETPGRGLQVLSLIVLDPSTVPGGFSFDAWRDELTRRLPLVPVLRRRLVEVPLALHRPLWVDEPDLDLEYHVRRVDVPGPVSVGQLAELVAAIAEKPLDRSRPLWELHLVEGLDGGRVGVIAKLHHALMDGIAGMASMASLFSFEPAGAPLAPAPPGPADRVPGTLELLAGAVGGLAQQPVKLAQAMGSTAASVVGMARRPRWSEHDVAPFTAPRTRFNRAISGKRMVAFTSLPLDEVAAIRHTFGVTVNDVVLAIVAGALRAYLDARSELPESSLIAAVPVAVQEGRARALSNEVSLVRVGLGTDLDDPVARLRAVHAGSRRARERDAAHGSLLSPRWLDVLPAPLISLGTRSYTQLRLAEVVPPMFNVIVSNVPGPPVPLYLGGARLAAIHPLGPIFDGVGLNVTIISNVGSVDFGLVACRDRVPDLRELSAGLRDACTELRDAVPESKRSFGH